MPSSSAKVAPTPTRQNKGEQVLEVSGICKNYGNLRALENVSFQVKKGEIVGFLGMNGSGKTTTMDIISGCIGCDEGTIRIHGHDLYGNPTEAKKNIGYLPDSPPLSPYSTVKETIEFAGSLHLLKETQNKRRQQELVEMLTLESVWKRPISQLSQRLQAASGSGSSSDP
jgi:ABC-2 type transport system ATP-binding protein